MLAHFTHHLLTALPMPLLPFIRNDFNLDYTQSALVISAFSLSYGIGQLPAGWLADRIGPRILITVGIVGVALAGILVGLSQTYIMMLVFLVLMGLAGGGYHPAAAPLVSASVEPEKRGRALGVHLIGGSGSFFVSPIVAAAIATAWGWRVPFLGLAVPTAAFGIIFYMILRRQAGMSQVQRVRTESHDKAPPPSGYLRRLVPFLTLSVLTSGICFSITAFITLYMVDHFGVSEGTAASFLAIIFSAGLWAGPLGGYISDRLGRVKVILVICLITGCVYYLLNLVPFGVGFGALLLVIGIATYTRMTVSESYIMGQAPARHRSTIYGIYYFGMMETGGVLSPVIGTLIDHFGFHTSFTIGSVAIIAVTLICSVFLWGIKD